jgi:dTDP-4-dehydrorhamnose reductase
MKIAITGASGRLGYRFFEYFSSNGHEAIGTVMKHASDKKGMVQVDLTDREKTTSFISESRPDAVIHTAALTDVDFCETNQEAAFRQNVLATRNVLDGCKKAGSAIIFISTSFVFGRGPKAFSEDDSREPVNYYGITKMKAEDEVSSSDLDFLIIRTDQPYYWVKSWQKDNHVTKILKKLGAGEEYSDLTDWYNNPTFLPDIINATQKLMAKDKHGVYNIVGPDYVSRYDWSLKIADIFGKNKDILIPITSDSLALPAARPNANVSNKKAELETGIKFSGIEEGLSLMKAASSSAL